MSGTPEIFNFASSRSKAIPAIAGSSILEPPSTLMRVPGPASNEESTRRGTLYLPANSTARI